MTTRKSIAVSLAAVFAFGFALATEAQAFGPKHAGASEAEAESVEVRNKWALAIGINRFADSKIPALKFAQKSSGDFSRGLKDQDCGHFPLDHVLVVNGPDATKANIEQAFDEWLYKKALPDDYVVIYINSRVLKNAAGDAVICANDTSFADPDKTGINLPELLKTARQRTGTQHLVCVLDTSPCVPSSEKPVHDTKWLATSTGATVLSAAEIFKPSLDDAVDMQSYFAHYFLEALKTGGANFPLAMVAEYVWQKIQEATKADASGAQVAILSLPSEQSQTMTIPVGVIARGPAPPKKVAIGHPLDNLGMDHPNIVAPTLNKSKPTINIQSRRQTIAGRPVVTTKKVAIAPTLQPKPQAEKTVVAATSDDDGDDNFDPNLDLRPYIAKIKQDIQKKWQMPKGFESRKVTTMFSIMSNGTISNASIVEGSGNDEVDKSALAALQLASPVDPLPKGAPRSVDIKYVFDWKTKIGSQ